MAQEPMVTTAYAWRRFIAAVLMVGGAIALSIISRSSGIASPASSGESNVATYTYSCCSASLVDTTYHPGEVMDVRWIRSVDSPATSPRVIILLSARLSGPFASVEGLKSSMTASPHALRAVDVASLVRRVSNTSGASPVTRLRIPATASPGYYNLSFTIGSSPRSVVMSAASIVRVAK